MLSPKKSTTLLQPTAKMICCVVGDEEYCLDMSSVSAITLANQITPNVETTGPLGWLSTKQNQLPVYDLAQQLQGSATNHTTTAQEGFVLILNAQQPFALKVDRVAGAMDVASQQFTPLPLIANPTTDKVFKGIVKFEHKWALYADPVKFHPDSVAASQQHTIVATSHPAPPPVRVTTQPQKNSKLQILLFSTALSVNTKLELPTIIFGLSLTQVHQILDVTPILPVPYAPSYMVGITNWRNQAVPVVDLAVRLGLSHTPVAPQSVAAKSRLLIARAAQHNELIGFLINPQVKAFPLPLPYQPNQQALSLDQELIRGVFELEGMPLVIPDIDGILTHRFAPHPSPVL